MITDAVMSANTKVQALTTLLGGSDLMLCPNSGTFAIPGFDGSATVMTALRESAHRVLYAFADSAVMNGMSANTRIVALTPPWQKALIAADVVVGIILLLAVVLTTRSLVKAARKERSAH